MITSSRTGIVVLALLATPAAADWLVLESGEEIETAGEWKIDGRRVVYESVRGTLSSVRLSGVNVDASRALTHSKLEEVEARREQAPEVTVREPVLVFTDADFPSAEAAAPPPVTRGNRAPAGKGVPGAEVKAEERLVPASQGLENRLARQLPGSAAIEVLNWSVHAAGDRQVSIVGYLQNVSQKVATAIGLTVVLVDAEDVVVENAEAQLSSSVLAPGIQAFFETRFSETVNFAGVEFAARSIDLDVVEDDAGVALPGV